jgi:hypothetical protein
VEKRLSSQRVTVTIHGHAHESKAFRQNRIQSLTPVDLVKMKFAALSDSDSDDEYEFDHEEVEADADVDISYDDNDPDTRRKGRRGSKSKSPSNRGVGSSDSSLQQLLHPKASKGNLYHDSAA